MSTIDLYDQHGFVAQVPLPDIVASKAGSFKIGKILRQGGNGVVAEANRRAPNGNNLGKCAVKFLKRLDSSRVDRFRNEARVLDALDHSRITRFHGNGEVVVSGHTIPWMAIELGGENLRRHVESQGPLSPEALGIAAIQAIRAVGHIHSKGFIHRDIKPENFVWDATVPGSIQMIDFGIAKQSGEDVSARPLDQFTQQMEFVGPVFFSSPELIAYASDKTQQVDQRSDLFQFGKMLWYLATKKISAGYPAKRLCPVNGELHELVVSLLNDDPNDRPGNAAEVEQSLMKIFPAAG